MNTDLLAKMETLNQQVQLELNKKNIETESKLDSLIAVIQERSNTENIN